MAVQRPGALHSGEKTDNERAAETPQTLYDRDFALWATEQAQALKDRRATALDWDNLAEEIEALAKRDERSLESYLQNALHHLLKLTYWTAELQRNQAHWRIDARNARRAVKRIIQDNKSFLNYAADYFPKAYEYAREDAEDLIGRSLPETCPWTLDQVLDESFWPEPANGETPASAT